MRSRYSHVVYEAVPYDEIDALRPFDDLPAAAVTTHDQAVDRLEDANDDEILAVASVSMATGYHLAQIPLTVITIDELSTETISQLAAATTRDIATYRYITLGKRPAHENHTLGEYETAELG